MRNLRPVPWVGLLLLGCCGLCWAEAFAAPPAFPGAVGQGALAVGGRGGDVYHVTTLEDYHPKGESAIEGSFRHALRSIKGPRTIVFDVSGPIALKAPIEVYKSNVTVAGQTSPGGITLWGYPFDISDEAHDVVVRHIRVRCGDFHARQGGTANNEPGSLARRADLDASSANAIQVSSHVDRVILDHVSASWGMDETISVTQSRNVTVQFCLIAESLNHSKHPKGDHGFGSLIRGEITPEDAAQNIGGYTLYGNLWAFHKDRNPSFGGQQKTEEGQTESNRRSTDANLVNNLIYGWGSKATHRNELGSVRLNILGNYYINGPEKDTKYFFSGTDDGGPTEIYHAGNKHDRKVDGKLNGVAATTALSFQKMEPVDRVLSEGEGEPFGFLGKLVTKIATADQTYSYVSRKVGASLWRDAVDERIITAMKRNTGKLLNSQEEYRTADGQLPGIDDLPQNTRPADFDTDGDGMPNAWETEHGLNPESPDDGAAVGLSKRGYTNLEVYLAEAAQAPR